MSYIERYMKALATYLEGTCFCKYPCTNAMILDAIKAKGVDCAVDEDCRNIHGDPLVVIPNVQGKYFVVIDEEIYAMYVDGIVYCPAI